MNKPSSLIISITCSITLLLGIAGCTNPVATDESTFVVQKAEIKVALLRAKLNFVTAREEIENASGSIDSNQYAQLISEIDDQIAGIDKILPELMESRKTSAAYYKNTRRVMEEWELKSLEVLSHAKELNG